MKYDLSTASVASIEQSTRDAIEQAEALVNLATSSSGTSFADRVAPLDAALLVISDAGGYGPFLAHCHTDEAVRQAGHDAKERLDKWSSDLTFRPEINDAVMAVDDGDLEGLEARSLKFWRRDLKRAGHGLAPTDRDELQRLHSRLIEISVAFNKNIADDTSTLELPRDDLDGLPQSYIDALSEGSRPDTVVVSMEYPQYEPFMRQATNRDHRRALQHIYLNRAPANLPLLAEAVAVRHRIAELLGYPTWADHQMDLKMADTDAVREFYRSIIPGLTLRAQTERDELQALLDADHPGAELSPWDWVFYDDQQARTEFGIDQNEVATYFPLDAVVRAMLDITAEVFGLRYEPVTGIGTWHEDVRTYRIIDAATNQPLAVFFLDLHPRDGKYTHAACWSLQKGCRRDDGTYRSPYAGVLANFTKPTPETPSLLRHNEVLTLFHEFGHVLHECLTDVPLGRFAGFDTEWDFVEAPSQIMENWTWNADVLRRFAKHHETGAPIPHKLVDGLVRLRDHNIALKLLRQVYYGTLDLTLHTAGPTPDLGEVDREAHRLTLLPFHEDTMFAAGFGHLLGGYDAGYYGYLWSMVYGDDMFSVFESEGVLSPEVGRRYRREVLAPGSSRDAIEHLRAFLGRDPSTEAFMRKIGL